MHIVKSAIIILEVLLLFNLIIFVHELGHFLAARWRGLKVERFAVWFGTPIWKTKINGVEYALGCIPAGGYVSLPQMAPMEMIEGRTEANAAPLPNISALDKIIVAIAGPLFSFLLAISFAVIVWIAGKPAGATDNSTVVGWAEKTGPAYLAGIRPGDQIISIDDKPVNQFSPPSPESITWRIVSSEGSDIKITFLRDKVEHVVHVVPVKAHTEWYERKSLRKVMIGPVQPAIVGEVASNSPAAVAGLQTNDEIIALNGEKIYSVAAVLSEEESMTNGPIRPLDLTIKRGSETFDKIVTPEKPLKPAGTGPIMGISWLVGSTNETLIHPGPWEQIQSSADQIFSTIGVVFSRKTDIGVQQLGGAVMIIRLYSNLFDNENGWRLVLWFSVVLNVNLALLNMLPFPVLDGGHITLALIEVVSRRPVSARLLNLIQSACAMLLIAFMLFIAFFDAGDWFRSAHKDREMNAPLEFAPKK
jgi:regulator of sigma E protease